MSWSLHRSIQGFLFLAVALCCCSLEAAQPIAGTFRPATTAPTRPSTTSASQGIGEYGRDVIVLDELVESYEAVPFAHRVHAEMADMWDGCETCHHHTPTTAPAAAGKAASPAEHHTQDEASAIPACKSCHPKEPSRAEIEMPSLKGAYHRQCLNCHRDWMGENACVICHATRENGTASRPSSRPLAPDDITGRMHKPLTPPTTVEIRARYTPVDGENVLFRHDEHAKDFGIKCVACHRRDSCGDCHSSTPTTSSAATKAITGPSRLLKPSMTWRDSHEPCISCHQQDKCSSCHYQEGQEAPPAFRHEMTGQVLDKDHATLVCGACHEHYGTAPAPTCSGAGCHDRAVTFPVDRPGPYTPRVTTAPAATKTVTPPTTSATQPATRPLIIRIRRGAQ